MTLSPMSTPTSTFSPTDSISTVATEPETKANLDTISYVKSLMIDSSKLLGLYSTLKNTYLKLCKEYNYLLTKFNDNEKAKLQLIQENEELKQAMAELLQDRSSKKRRKSRKALAFYKFTKVLRFCRIFLSLFFFLNCKQIHDLIDGMLLWMNLPNSNKCSWS